MEAVPGSEPRVLGRDIGASLTRALMDLASVRSAPPPRAGSADSIPAGLAMGSLARLRGPVLARIWHPSRTLTIENMTGTTP